MGGINTLSLPHVKPIKQKTMKTKAELIKELESMLSEYEYTYTEGDTADSVQEYCSDRIAETEVIYYASAMEYLQRNDNSLRESLEIAGKMGYKPEDLNSEILATLLQQRYMQEELSEMTTDIEDLIQEIEDSEDEDEE